MYDCLTKILIGNSLPSEAPSRRLEKVTVMRKHLPPSRRAWLPTLEAWHYWAVVKGRPSLAITLISQVKIIFH